MFKKLFGKKSHEVASGPATKMPAWVPKLNPEDMGIRTEDELYQRLIALWAVVGAAKTGQAYFAEYIEQNGMMDWLTPNERAFLFSQSRSERQINQFSWQAECLQLLAWCGGLYGNLDLPRTYSELGDWFALFPADMEDVGRLRRALKVRDKNELIMWSDKLMNAHWLVRDKRINNKSAQINLDGEVVQEWHYAINWMVYFLEDPQDWDDVTTDT